MKRIIICDSGLGGLNIASHFFTIPGGAEAEPCELIYFNAYPEKGRGFNTLPDERAQENQFRSVLEGMIPFAPDLCLIACNTLSIVWERLRAWWQPPFPVSGIVEAAVDVMADALKEEPGASIIILGTKTTVESGVYPERLLRRGIAGDRVHSLGCPGLPTVLESDPASAAIRDRIAGIAGEAVKQLQPRPAKLLLGLCCTHFGFAEPLWLGEFEKAFGIPVEIVNPNDRFGGGLRAVSFRYLARIPLFGGARDNIGRFFAVSAPAITEALQTAEPKPALFELNP